MKTHFMILVLLIHARFSFFLEIKDFGMHVVMFKMIYHLEHRKLKKIGDPG